MLETLSTNYSYRNGRARMYEFGKIFLPSSDPEQLPEERVILTLGTYGAGDFYELKGVVEALLRTLHVAPARFTACLLYTSRCV